MKIKRVTIRNQMIYQSIILLMGVWYDDIAEEMSIDAMVMNNHLTNYATISTRVEDEDLGFELASHEDSAEKVKAKFLAYIDAADMAQVNRIMAEIRAADNPLDGLEQQDEKTKKK